jgi:hypothetical protein
MRISMSPALSGGEDGLARRCCADLSLSSTRRIAHHLDPGSSNLADDLRNAGLPPGVSRFRYSRSSRSFSLLSRCDRGPSTGELFAPSRFSSRFLTTRRNEARKFGGFDQNPSPQADSPEATIPNPPTNGPRGEAQFARRLAYTNSQLRALHGKDLQLQTR